MGMSQIEQNSCSQLYKRTLFVNTILVSFHTLNMTEHRKPLPTQLYKRFVSETKSPL